MPKIAYVYEGIEPEAPRSERFKLMNPNILVDYMKVVKVRKCFGKKFTIISAPPMI